MDVSVETAKANMMALLEHVKSLESENAILRQRCAELKSTNETLANKLHDAETNPETVFVDRGHPLQVCVGQRRLTLTGHSDGSIGVDSCGIPFRLKLE